MTTSTAVQQFLRDLNNEIEAKASAKVTKAMKLFAQIDNTMKGVVIHNSPFYRGKTLLTAKNLRDWFQTLDLMDEIDSLIDDMEYDLRVGSEINPNPEMPS